MSSYRPLGRFLASIVDTAIDAPLIDNAARLLDLLNGLSPEKLRRILNRSDERGYTPLHIAAERNQPESLKCLLIKDANPNIRSTLSTSEVTPLHIAALHGHLACLQLLVQLGGDIMVQDRCHLTPVDYAQINGQDLCFNYLNEVIARRQAEERSGVEDVLIQVESNLAIDNVQTLNHWKQLSDLFPLSLNSHDPSQLESIMYRHCIIINNRDMVRVLGRITKDIPISLHGASLLHAACRYGRTQLTQLLVQKVPDIMFSITNEAYNPLHVAVVHQHLDIVKTLVLSQVGRAKSRKISEAGGEKESSLRESLHLQQARFGEPTMSGHTVLHFAVALNNVDILHLLLKHHRKLKLSYEASKCGYTPLHLAVFLNHSECAKLLLKCGANPNACVSATPNAEELSHISSSILSEAVINKNLGLLQLLLDYGGEDKGHGAIRLCIPSAEHKDFIVPLLGSLVRLDDGLKLNKQTARKVKTGLAEWANLQLTEVKPLWIARAIQCCKFLKGQKIETGSMCDYLTTINLSGNQLSWLPRELFLLSGLQILNASSNRVTGLPDFQQAYNPEKDSYEWPCGNLTRLNLSKNQLTELPHFLFKIPKLSYLDVSYNRLLYLPFDLWSAPKLYQVIGSHNRLEALPTNWPEVLNTFPVFEPERHSPDQVAAGQRDGRKGGRAPKRKKLSVQGQLHHTVTSSFECSTKEPSISKLEDCLNISNSNLPVEWVTEESREEVYDGLGILNLSNNMIREIPDNLPCLCPKLIRLDLSHNQIQSISMPRQFPAHLKHLSLSHNHIETLNCRDALSKPLPCTNPLVLAEMDTILRDNVTFCSHRQHSQLSRLSVLELNSCQLREVNMQSQAPASKRKKGQPDYEGVQQGNLEPGGSCKVRHRDALVCPLLTRLLLAHNQLDRVPDSICEMVSLNSLDLSHNDIIELPAQLGRLCNLWEFPLDGLKLISPPHNIIERGKTRDIIGFLWSLLQRARPYHRMKLMLVGKAARGKTTLLSKISERGQTGLQENWALNRMVGADKLRSNLSTVGIVVSDWTYYKKVRESQTSLRSITFMTWDFGGQEEYYATHQCFISRRSLYLLVWNVTHGIVGAKELRPWLLNIQARAPNSPVIIVGTHIDKLSTRQLKDECRNCQDYIGRMYGTVDTQREGFPHIMKSMLVSCKSGRGINELRDAVFEVASQVKENTVAGRGIGCGRIPDYRLLMDQLVPASYLQLEDTVRNLAIQMRTLNKPPVLSYKELRELVFADSRTLISRHSADRELEQAVRFLHDNGTLLHYEDPLLADFYFVDPQWLCDMLAHIVTVREINPFVREGVMRIADFSLIFNDDEFPMRWKREYIRLLTTFEVAVGLSDGELLVPSALPFEKPNLPCNAFPHTVRMLPALRHAYIIPFVPSGFWPRLMSRVLSDKTIIQLARDGCNIADDDMTQLSWVKWRQGLILQFGNLTLMTIEELKDSLFPEHPQRRGIKFSREERWESVRINTKISGISVTVPDLYPVLKYLEHAQKSTQRPSTASLQSTSSATSTQSTSGDCLCPIPETAQDVGERKSQFLPSVPEIALDESSQMSSHDSQAESHDSGVTEGCDGDSCANRVVGIDMIDEEVKKLAIKCKDRCRLLSCDVASPPRSARSTSSRLTGPSDDGPVPSIDARLNSVDSRRRVPSNDISPRPSIRSASHSSHASTTPTVPSAPPIVDEEAHDKMRAGLISKAVDHVTLLIEDWFTGVKPRYHLVPCPHCASSGNHGSSGGSHGDGELPHQVHLLRSFSTDISLQVTSNKGAGLTGAWTFDEECLSLGATQLKISSTEVKSSPKPQLAAPHITPSPLPPVTSAQKSPAQKPRPTSVKTFSKSPWRQLTQFARKPQIAAAPKPPSALPSPDGVYREDGGGRYLEPEWDRGGVVDPYNYAFRYDDCVVTARNQDFVTCPAHGKILLRYMAPDTLFIAQGKEILVSGDDCVEEGVLGQGAYATVFQVRIRKQGHSDFSGTYALKALTKEWKSSASSSTPGEATPPRLPSRYSILTGFNNLKKELAILSPLKNAHVIRLHGVVLRPLGLILEHAPQGSLKKTLEQYHDVQQHLRGNVAQAVIIQVARAIQYLHCCSIIYRDLKSDNVLVWKFPIPQDSILIPTGRLGLETVLVKLSDLGISQFAATQGARGLVGTPGFMAPEILKYQGKEVYTDQVDIFSFGMFMYELITLHIPYESLTAQQANQANESGTRPALTRKNLQCAVLLRELMVWCWQQHPDNRPTADDIITTAQSNQFLRLLNGIRISSGGQVTAACVAVAPTSSRLSSSPLHRQHSGRAIPSPHPPIHTNLTNPFVFDRNLSGDSHSMTDAASGDQDASGDTWLTCGDTELSHSDSSSGQTLLRTNEVKSVVSSDQVKENVYCQRSAIAENTHSLVLATDTGDALEHRDQHIQSVSDAGFFSKPATTEGERPELCQRGSDRGDSGRSTGKSDSGVFPSVNGDHSRTEAQESSGREHSEASTCQSSALVDDGHVSPSNQPPPPANLPSLSSEPPFPFHHPLSTTCSPVPRPLSAPTSPPSTEILEELPRPPENIAHTQRSLSSDGKYPTLPPHVSHTTPHIHLTSTKSSVFSEARTKTNVSPRIHWSEERELDSTTFSPSGDSLFHLPEEEGSFEVWVASSDAHRAVLSVVGYNGQFTTLEEMDVGDSPVLSVSVVGSNVWVGFQIGYIVIFEVSSHHLVGQTWLRQYTPIISIIHIAEMKRVYVTLGDGSVFAYDDELPPSSDVGTLRLSPICEYHDLGQTANCVTAVPLVNEFGSGTSHELWVGQSEAMITVLNPDDLSVVKFIHNTSDTSPTPTYMAYLTYANLVYSSHTGEGELQPSVSVYGALYHGQYVTQWNASSKEMITCYNCRECLKDSEECKISSLHYHSLQLLVGLCSGKILMLDALTYTHLSTLTCHRAAVHSMHTLTVLPDVESFSHSRSAAQQWSSGSGSRTKASRNSFPERPSLGSMSLSGSQPNSANPSPIPMSLTGAYSSTGLRHYSEHSLVSQSITSSSSGSSSERNRLGPRLLSFGSGFKSYFDGPESKPHLDSGFMLVWDLHSHSGLPPT